MYLPIYYKIDAPRGGAFSTNFFQERGHILDHFLCLFLYLGGTFLYFVNRRAFYLIFDQFLTLKQKSPSPWSEGILNSPRSIFEMETMFLGRPPR